MGWRWGWRRGWGGWSPWPGNGPFSYLPPWERPGWRFGRGACWRLFGNPWLYSAYTYPYTGYYTPWYAPWYSMPYYPPYWW